MVRKLILIVLILGLAGGAVWYFAIRKNTSTPTSTDQGFKSFFPLNGGSTIKDETQSEGETVVENTDSTNNTITKSRFTKVTNSAIAGYKVYTTTKTISIPNPIPKQKPTTQTITDHIIRYVSRQSGFVYEIKNKDLPVQISNIFLPNIYEVSFLDNNNTALLRFIQSDNKTIGTYSVPIPLENSDGSRTQKEGLFLTNNILSYTASYDTKEFAGLTVKNGISTINTFNSSEKQKRELLVSPLKEWIISWPQPKTLYLQTKAAGTAEGFLYKIDRDERKLRRVVGNVLGLTTNVSPSGLYVIYSESKGKSFITKILNTKTGVVQTVGLSILPEKCAWLKNEDLICAGNTSIPEGIYPDVWYAGLVTFSDALYHIYTQNNVFDVVYNNDNESFDMTSLQVDEETKEVYFINKTTGTLWKTSL